MMKKSNCEMLKVEGFPQLLSREKKDWQHPQMTCLSINRTKSGSVAAKFEDEDKTFAQS